MGICVDDVLASVRGVVDLSPPEALDEAQDFLMRQGYSVTYRTTTTLTVKRQVSDNATGQESIFELIVMALPQSGGGVRIKVRGNDREAVRDRQAAWLEWSETLPKREMEQPEAAATTESVTREIVGQEAPRPTTAADNDVPQRGYCSNCGQLLDPNAQFCQSCGQLVHQTARIPTPQAYVPTPPPPQSQQGYRDPGVWGELLLRVGNTLFTGRGVQDVVIYDNRVLITTARLRGVGEESIPYRRIAGVSVKPGFFFSELSIETTGGEVVTVKGIPRGQAWKAYDLINERL